MCQTLPPRSLANYPSVGKNGVQKLACTITAAGFDDELVPLAAAVSLHNQGARSVLAALAPSVDLSFKQSLSHELCHFPVRP